MNSLLNFSYVYFNRNEIGGTRGESKFIIKSKSDTIMAKRQKTNSKDNSLQLPHKKNKRRSQQKPYKKPGVTTGAEGANTCFSTIYNFDTVYTFSHIIIQCA